MSIEQTYVRIRAIESGHAHGCPSATAQTMLAEVETATCGTCAALAVLEGVRRLADYWPSTLTWPERSVEELTAAADKVLLDPAAGSCWKHRPPQAEH
jgi:hypothetical protein